MLKNKMTLNKLKTLFTFIIFLNFSSLVNAKSPPESFADLEVGKTIAVSVLESYKSNNEFVGNGELYLNGQATLKIIDNVQGTEPSTELITVAPKLTTDTEAGTSKSVNFKVSNILCKDIEQLFKNKKDNKINILKLSFIVTLSQKNIVASHFLNHKQLFDIPRLI